MKCATRINSFIFNGNTVVEAMREIGKIGNLEYVDLNFPEHFEKMKIESIKSSLDENGLSLNAVNIRFRSLFINGEFGNPNDDISEQAVQICLDAVKACEALGGNQIIIWLGFDGFDYSFQIDYISVWKKVVSSFRRVCDSTKLNISIEYKPYEERVHALIDSFGTTMLMLQDVGRDNLGVTLDFCHMLMKKENPAFAVSYLLEHNKLYNMHLNDGEGSTDDGLMVGAVNLWKTVEVMYYLKKYSFSGVIYFDTFPKRENAIEECKANIEMCLTIEKMLERVGIENIHKIISTNDAVSVNKMFINMLK